MSLKAGLIRWAIKLAPMGLVPWVANKKLRGIATLQKVSFNLDSRTAYVSTMLNGEAEPIQVQVDGFSVTRDGDAYQFVVDKMESNKPWLNTIFSRITGKAWPLPVPPKHSAEAKLLAELLQPKNPAA